jgi:fido (protein-threonine AMPylation protein)
MIQGSSHMPPNLLVAKEMEDFFVWYETNKSTYIRSLAAEMHERLVTIHPFIDGNGRTSRLVMNLVYCNMATSLPISKGIMKVECAIIKHWKPHKLKPEDFYYSSLK